MKNFFTLFDYNIALGEVLFCKGSKHICYLLVINKDTALLDKAGVGYIKLLAEENAELVGEFGIRQAPTLIVVNGDAYD